MKLVAAVLFCAFSSFAHPQGLTPECEITGETSIADEIADEMDEIDHCVVLVRSSEAPHEVMGVGVYGLGRTVLIAETPLGLSRALNLEFKVLNKRVKALYDFHVGCISYYNIQSEEDFNPDEAVHAEMFQLASSPMLLVGTTVSWNEHGIVITKDRRLTVGKGSVSVPVSNIEQKIGDFIFIGTTLYGVCTYRTREKAIYRFHSLLY